MKLYVISDVHGFYDEMMDALNKAGFDPNNEEHWLISCGDEFDRGPKPVEVMRYFSGLKRKVIIRGNHTLLFEDLCRRGHPEWYDQSNGTLSTVLCLGCYSSIYEFDMCCEKASNRTKKYRNNMVNYFETKNHIFVHSWIPNVSDWRNASQDEWDNAMWGNPFEKAEQGLLPDKTIVFGHFHTSYARCKYENKPEWGNQADFSPYYGTGYIGIDACTARSGRVNVIVIEDEFLEK